MELDMADDRSTWGRRRHAAAKFSGEYYPMRVEFFQRVLQTCITLMRRRSGTLSGSPPKPNREEKGHAMSNEANMEKLMTDLRVLTRDAEALMHATAGQAGEKMTELRQRLSAAVESAKATCQRLEEKAIAGAKAADKTIREHPYESIGAAFGVGLLIGVLVGRR
jgi:ElaB/YqjD/DUF883 family membrane-anchored ribosome-binding protein